MDPAPLPPAPFAVEQPAATATPQPPLTSHCTTSAPLSTSQKPSGNITTLSSPQINTYISRPSSYPSQPAKLLLLLTPGTGINALNNQLQADFWSEKGYVVIMPDLFGGDVAPNTAVEHVQPADVGEVDDKDDTPVTVSIPGLTATTASDTTNTTTAATTSTAQPASEGPGPQSPTSWLSLSSLKQGIASTAKSFLLDMWLARHTPETVLPLLNRVIFSAQEEFADALAFGGGWYGAGYCFGGRYILILAGSQDNKDLENSEDDAAKKSQGPVLKAAAVAHPTLVTAEELSAVRAPTSLICVADDPVFPQEILEEGKKALGKAGVEHHVSVYEGVPHGFAVLGDYGDKKIAKEQDRAGREMVEWLARF